MSCLQIIAILLLSAVGLGLMAGYLHTFIRTGRAWNHLPQASPPSTAPLTTTVTVVVAARNEAENLPTLFQNLENQTYNHNNLLLIIVDDHSDDATPQLAAQWCRAGTNRLFLSLCQGEYGKKAALAKAFSHARGRLIITTDADCTMSARWLETVVAFYEVSGARLIIGPVKLSGNSLFQRLQQLEFLSISITTGGTASVNRATMCNGANLAFERKLIASHNGLWQSKIASGDDIFLLQALKAQGEKIAFLKSTGALVETPAQKSIQSLLNQRVRWASKGRHYTDRDMLRLSRHVLLPNLWLVFMALVLPFAPLAGVGIALLVIVKSVADFWFLRQGRRFYNISYHLWLPVLLEMLYPVYVAVVALMVLSGKKLQWKGRRIGI